MLTSIIVVLTNERSLSWIIIEALDESEDLTAVYDEPKSIVDKPNVPVKVFITSRDDTLELHSLLSKFDNISIRAGLKSNDLRTLIDSKIGELVHKKKLMATIKKPQDKEVLTNRSSPSVLLHADGM